MAPPHKRSNRTQIAWPKWHMAVWIALKFRVHAKHFTWLPHTFGVRAWVCVSVCKGHEHNRGWGARARKKLVRDIIFMMLLFRNSGCIKTLLKSDNGLETHTHTATSFSNAIDTKFAVHLLAVGRFTCFVLLGLLCRRFIAVPCMARH